MHKFHIILIITAIFLAVSGLAIADVLPQAGPENQIFTTTSIIDAVGVTDQKTTAVWQVGDAGLDELPDAVCSESGACSGSIAYVTYSDAIMSNGGQVSEVRSFSMDTHGKTPGLYNIETTKVLTYNSQNGSHLMGAESYVLDVAGMWRKGFDSIVCVFAKGNTDTIPAFCNKVTASSKLISVTTAQVETRGALTAVAQGDDESCSSDLPAALKYEISVTPDVSGLSGYADGIVSTTFTVSVMEGRSDGDIFPNTGHAICETGDENCCKAAATAAGGYPESCREGTCHQDAFGVCNAIETRVGLGAGYHTVCHDDKATCKAACDALCQRPFMRGCYFTWSDDVLPGVDGCIWTFDHGEDGDQFCYLDRFYELASTLTYVDTATAAGGISTFNKVFDYQSGVDCVNC